MRFPARIFVACLLTAIPSPGADRNEEFPIPEIEVLPAGIKVAKSTAEEKPADAKDGTGANITAVLAIIPKDTAWGMTGIFKEPTEIDVFQFDDGPNISNGKKNKDKNFTLLTNCSPWSGRAGIGVRCGRLPPPGTKTLRLKGTVVGRVAPEIEPLTSDAIKLRNEQKIPVKVGDVTLEFQTKSLPPDDAEGKDMYLRVKATYSEWKRIRKIEFLTIDGKPITARRSGGGSGYRTENGKQIKHKMRKYGFDRAVRELKVKLTLWGKQRLARIPFDIRYGLDMRIQKEKEVGE